MDLESLRAVSCFQKLSTDELRLLNELVEERSVEPKTRVVREGDEIDAFYIIIKGLAHVRRQAQKREVLLGRIPQGGFFGEINLFDGGRATASIYAMDKVTLGVVSYGKMRSFMESNPSAGYKITSVLLTELSKRLRQTNERLVNTVYWTSLSSTPR